MGRSREYMSVFSSHWQTLHVIIQPRHGYWDCQKNLDRTPGCSRVGGGVKGYCMLFKNVVYDVGLGIAILIWGSVESTFSKYSFEREGGGNRKELLIMLTILDSPLFRLMDNVRINTILCSKFLARINHEPTGLCVRVKWNIDFLIYAIKHDRLSHSVLTLLDFKTLPGTE